MNNGYAAAARGVILVIAGPTAAGKSALAMKLAERVPVEIINGDSVQLYRGFDIGSAKPDKAEQALVPHHLISTVDPTEKLTAYRYMNLARKAAKDIDFRGKLPVLAGGSPFFIDAAINGLDTMAPADMAYRKVLRRYADIYGVEALYNRLYSLDPEATSGISQNDFMRISRRLEILRAIPGNWADLPRTATPVNMKVVKAVLDPERPELHRRIQLRVDEMLKAGFIEEVEKLLSRWPHDSPAFYSIGYRQIVEYLRGSVTLEQAREVICRDTRRLAKRQMTWFRKWKDAIFFKGSLASILDKALVKLPAHLYNLKCC